MIDRIPTLRVLCAGVLLTLLAGCSQQETPITAVAYPHEAAPASRRDTAQGPVVGFADADDTFGWMGIPYAAPPVGDLRWRAPHPPMQRSDLLEATGPGNACPYLNPLNESGEESDNVGGAEDCLYLNVWAPRQVPPEGLPVMVWIHGGANVLGTANSFTSFPELVAPYDVVVVSLNYRLGILGWFNHPALITGDPLDDSGNYAALDLIAGLQWVSDNIAAFGGDPQRVTIFGESAGGVNVLSLLTAKPARGLFHGAIAQSGLAANVPVALARNGLPGDEPVPTGSVPLVDGLLVRAGLAADLEAARKLQTEMPAVELRRFLRELPLGDLFRPLYGDGGIDMKAAQYKWLAPIADGAVMPPVRQLEAMKDPAQVADVPLLLGSNRDEMRLFQFMDPDQMSFLFGKLPRARDEETYLRRADYGSQLWRAVGVVEPAVRLAPQRSDQLFLYRFDWDDLPSNLLVDMKTLLGAAHGFDIGFVTGEAGDLVGRFGGNTSANAEGRQQLAAAMRSYWTEFAYTGAPGRGRDGTLPAWPSWGDSNGQSLILDTEDDGGIRVESANVTVADVRRRLLADPDIPLEQRCELDRELTGRFFVSALPWRPSAACR